MKFFGAIVFLLLWLGLADPSWGMASPWILQADGQYCLQMPTLRLRVDPLHGARITDFRLGFANLDGGWDGWGANVLLSANIEPDTYGSTFWVSPQSLWGWPPDATIDRNPYSAIVEGNTLTLQSERSSSLGIQVIKHLRPKGNQSIEIQYDLIPTEDTVAPVAPFPIAYAPWEVSRVAGSGITLFPSQNLQASTGDFVQPNLLTVGDLILWDHRSDTSQTPGDQTPGDQTPGDQSTEDQATEDQATGDQILRDQKLYADGLGGWLAHVDQGILFLKRFPDLPPAMMAPGEAEIEVYATASRRYLEIEVQGAYQVIDPSHPQTWMVEWQLRSLPDFLEDRLDSQDFLNWIREVAEESQ